MATASAPDTPVPTPVTRVCVVAPSLGILGGQAVQARRLVDHLNLGGAVAVDLLAVNPQLPGILGRLQSIKYVRTVLTSVAYVASLILRIRRYDVIHVFSASYWSFVLAPLPAMIVGRLFGRKVILNYHSGEAADHFARRPSAVRATRLAHEIIVPSDYLVDIFARFGMRARAIVNFVDVERIPYRRRSNLAPRFLSNRNLEPLYNVGCILRAFALIQRAYPRAELVVAGFGSQREMLESLATELGVRGVAFLGRVPSDQMGALFDASDVYVNSSNIDNMPLSILDAFASGTPVVSTDAGGIPYIVRSGENGLLVACDDHVALAASAIRLLRDPALAERLSDAARQECLMKYQWPVVRDQWVALYQGLARDDASLVVNATQIRGVR